MNRTIKFRVWDNVAKSFLENFKIYQYGNVSTEDIWMKNEERVVMQFTGLLDKNGVEIYEGDIVNEGGEYPSTLEVKWFDSLTYDSGGANHPGFYFVTNLTQGDLYYYSGFNKNTEVIGNIYENPELLQAKGGKE